LGERASIVARITPGSNNDPLIVRTFASFATFCLNSLRFLLSNNLCCLLWSGLGFPEITSERLSKKRVRPSEPTCFHRCSGHGLGPDNGPLILRTFASFAAFKFKSSSFSFVQ
jgi:hypothetical protein